VAHLWQDAEWQKGLYFSRYTTVAKSAYSFTNWTQFASTTCKNHENRWPIVAEIVFSAMHFKCDIKSEVYLYFWPYFFCTSTNTYLNVVGMWENQFACPLEAAIPTVCRKFRNSLAFSDKPTHVAHLLQLLRLVDHCSKNVFWKNKFLWVDCSRDPICHCRRHKLFSRYHQRGHDSEIKVVQMCHKPSRKESNERERERGKKRRGKRRGRRQREKKDGMNWRKSVEGYGKRSGRNMYVGWRKCTNPKCCEKRGQRWGRGQFCKHSVCPICTENFQLLERGPLTLRNLQICNLNCIRLLDKGTVGKLVQMTANHAREEGAF